MRLLRDTCRSIRDLLPLHVGGDLDPGPARRVDEHLHQCLSCFREFRELTAMRQRLGVLAEQQPPAAALEHFTEEVMARIALGERGPAAEAPGVRNRRASFAVPLAAAATLMVGVLLGQLARDRSLPYELPHVASGPASGGAPLVTPYVMPSNDPISGPISGGSLVGNGTSWSAPPSGFVPPLLDELGLQSMSAEESAFIDSNRIPPALRLKLLLGGRRDGLKCEPDRQWLPRVQEPVVPAQDG